MRKQRNAEKGTQATRVGLIKRTLIRPMCSDINLRALSLSKSAMGDRRVAPRGGYASEHNPFRMAAFLKAPSCTPDWPYAKHRCPNSDASNAKLVQNLSIRLYGHDLRQYSTRGVIIDACRRRQRGSSASPKHAQNATFEKQLREIEQASDHQALPPSSHHSGSV
jgi:hypothetical protein